jgi:hypothetical protein
MWAEIKKCPDCFSLVHGYVLGTAARGIVPREVDLRHISRTADISIPILYLRDEYIKWLEWWSVAVSERRQSNPCVWPLMQRCAGEWGST